MMLNKIDFYKRILDGKEYLIERDDILPYETLKFIKNSGYANIKRYIKSYPKGSLNKVPGYNVQLVCEKCGKSIEKEVTRTELEKYLSPDYYEFICEDCNKAIIEEAQRLDCIKKIQFYKEHNISIPSELQMFSKNNEEPNYFIRQYLNPSNIVESFNAVTAFEDMKLDFEKEDPIIIKEKILRMKYELFLLTPYWRIISSYVKLYSGNQCSFCSNTKGLNVHHKAYARHGEEIRYWRQDLVCVCHNCHGKLHNK